MFHSDLLKLPISRHGVLVDGYLSPSFSRLVFYEAFRRGGFGGPNSDFSEMSHVSCGAACLCLGTVQRYSTIIKKKFFLISLNIT